MTDIMNSPAVKQVMKQPGHVSADGAAQAQGEQPIRAAVVRAAELARDAESNARTRQHAKGKMTARERLGLLLDTGSFEEIGRFRGGDINGGKAGSAVITGFGDVYGRKIAVYAQDFSVRGGTLGRAEGEKICHLMDMALDLKVPIVAIVDSGGRPHPGRRRRADAVRPHLPQDLRRQRLRPADLADPGSVRRRAPCTARR